MSTMARASGCESGRDSASLMRSRVRASILSKSSSCCANAMITGGECYALLRHAKTPMASRRIILCVATFLALIAPAAAGRLPSGFVYLRDIDSSILQDIRYAGYDNFTGPPLPGYGPPEGTLRRDVP